jgi:hypothetical protein
VVIDRGDATTGVSADLILLHELVHAMQDQLFDLGTFIPDDASSDETLAARAVVEGSAFLYQTIIEGLYAGIEPDRLPWTDLFEPYVRALEELAADEDDPLQSASSVFPYFHGAHYLAQRWARGGAEAASEPFSNRPLASQNVLVLQADGALVPPGPTETSPDAPDAHAFQDADRLGAWVAYLFGARNGIEREAARGYAESVANDRAFVYYDAEADTVAFSWRLELTSADLASAFARSVAPPASGAWSIAVDGPSVVVAAAQDPNLVTQLSDGTFALPLSGLTGHPRFRRSAGWASRGRRVLFEPAGQ